MHKSASFQVEIRHKIRVLFFLFHSILNFGPIFLFVGIMTKKELVYSLRLTYAKACRKKSLFHATHAKSCYISHDNTTNQQNKLLERFYFLWKTVNQTTVMYNFYMELEKKPVLKHQIPIVFPSKIFCLKIHV